MPDDATYTITELADLAGVTPRTVRYYLSQGLLPSAGQTGPGTRYSESHLARLRVIRGLQAEHLPLAEIRKRLSDVDDDEVVTLAEQGATPPPTDSALDYVRSILRETQAPYGPARMRASMSNRCVAGGRIHAVACRHTCPHVRRAPRRVPSLGCEAGRPLPMGADRPGHGCRAAHPSAAWPDAEQAGGPSRDDRPRTPRGGPVMTEPTVSIRTDRRYIRANGKSRRFVLARVTAPAARPAPPGRRSTWPSCSIARAPCRAPSSRRPSWPSRKPSAIFCPRTGSASSSTTTRSRS